MSLRATMTAYPRVSRYVQRVAAMIACCIFLTAATCLGDFKVGDEVQFTRAGQTFLGKVVGIRTSGRFLEIETTADGSTRKIIVQAANVTPITKPSGREMRTWSDASGRFKIEATFESQTAFDVVLREKDGTKVKVALDKLSPEDQEYVAGLDSGGSENPFEAGLMDSASDSSDSQAGPTASRGSGTFSLPVAAVAGKVTPIALQNMGPAADVTDDSSGLDFSAISTASVSLPAAENGEEIGRPVVISTAGTDLCYGVRASRRAEEPYTQIMLIDGERRKTRELVRIEGYNVWLCSADPESGDVLGAVMKKGEDKSNSLCVISGISEGNPTILAHWRIFPDDEKKADYVRFRKLLPNQVAIVVVGGQVRAYDYGAKQAIWTVPSKMFNEPAVSPGGRYTAIVVDKQCAVLETKTGKQLGSIPVTWGGPTSIGFSPDGTKLALTSGTQVRVVEITSGKDLLVHEANVNLAGMGKPLLWLTDEFLLFPSGHLLSVTRNLIVWNYRVDQDALEFTDLEHHGLITFKGRNLASIVRVPHTSATGAAERDVSNIAALKTGDPIAINTSGSGPGVSAGDMQKWLVDAASRSGYRPTPSAQIQLFASVTRGKQTKQSYHSFGSFGSEEVTFTPYISKVEIRQNGTTIWQRTGQSFMPHFVSGDKTLQQIARENEKPDPRFFQSFVVPPQILKLEFQNGFGTSRVSADGITDING